MSEELLHVTQADREAAAQWGFIECRHCSEYEGNFVDDLAADFAKHRLSALIDHLEADGGVEYEVWQKDAFGDDTDGMVAGSTSLADAQHYAAVYGQDGPTWIVEVTRRSLSALPVLGVGR